jgi:NAD(P)-dependent dehydrogenase (short-subunit alcohol dehydrogenase family)
MTASQQKGTVAVVGAGDYIGAAIAKRFAAGGYAVFAGRRNGDRLAPLKAEIEAAGGRCESPPSCRKPIPMPRSMSASSMLAAM